LKRIVCHISTVHPSTDIRIFEKECQSLAKAGHDVVLIARHKRIEEIRKVKIIALPPTAGRFIRGIKSGYWAYQKALRTKAQVYHFHDPELVPIGFLLSLGKKKVVYDVHEDVPRDILTKEWIPAYLRKTVSIFFKIFEDYVAKRLSYIVTATPHIGDRFRQLGCRVMAINNYPFLNEFIPSIGDWQDKERAVCYVGIIEEMRGISGMIEAIDRTDAKLFLAGRFSSTAQRDRMTTLPGWEKIKELGQIGRSEVAHLLSKSMAGLVLFHPVPNNVDALPNKLFEYMSASIPVIASDFPLWKEIIEGNRCGICVDPLDPSEIANAIQWVIDHPREAYEMGRNGRKMVEEKFNWELEEKKLISVYEELLQDRKLEEEMRGFF
jgi:glycosyltransferase involved in cell wall biosynthesis